jgi:biopolymer transport protein TolR
MPKSDINVTPLIDVLLVLLIIFIVVVPQAPRALDASLAQTAKPPVMTAATSLVLEVLAEEFRLNATPVLTLRDLDERLHAAFEARRDATLFIRTADDVRYARLIDAIDVARGAGAERIGIAGDDSSSVSAGRPPARPPSRSRDATRRGPATP